MPDGTCEVEGCQKPKHKRQWCGAHYLRWWKHGDPEVTVRVPRDRCEVEGCDRQPRSRTAGICEMHYYRNRRHGDPLTVIEPQRGPDPTYRAAHSRVARDHGPARTHACVDCGRAAHHWSYTHTASRELVSPGGQPYSADPADYEPRCARCHVAYDAAR